MNIRKFISIILVSIAFCFVFNVAKAVTIEELLKEIARLLTSIVQFQKQPAEIQGRPTTWCHDFNVDLKYGDTGNEVEALQIALEKEGLYTKGTNPPHFDESLASAVVGFQEKYRDEILTPWGLAHGTGFVGRTTRAKLNKLYGCGVVPLSPLCSDSDGGKNYYQKGTVTKDGKTYNDYCQEALYLKEYFCLPDGKVGEENVACPDNTTCQDGACIKIGSLTLSTSPNNPPSQTVAYGTRDLELLRFSLTADPTEDIEIDGIAIEFYHKVYGEILPSKVLTNLRILYDNTQYGPSLPNLSSITEIGPDGSWSYSTTYAWFYGHLIIPKGSTKTLRLVADITQDENIGIDSITTLIPSWTGLGGIFAKGTPAHFIAKGVRSRKVPSISGEAFGNMFYFRKQSSEGSLTISTSPEIPQDQTYLKGTSGAKLLKIDFVASPQEAVKVTKVTVYISKDLTDASKIPSAGDLKNIKLVRQDGKIYGKVVSDIGDLPADEFGGRVFSQTSDEFVINAGSVSSLTLLADIPITSTADSFESFIPSVNVSDLISSIGLVSGKNIIVRGGAGGRINITSGLETKNIETQLALISQIISLLIEQLKKSIGK